MQTRRLQKYKLLCGVALCAMAVNGIAPVAAAAAAAESGSNDGNTTTPIKHVIVIIGENRTFDHLFATYQPVNSGETVLNLLSEGIVNTDGTPGPNYSKFPQRETLNTVTYQISPSRTTPYTTLPAPLAGGGPPPFTNIEDATTYENGLLLSDYVLLTTGAVTVPSGQPDTRIMYDGKDVNNLPPGPYQLTPGGATTTTPKVRCIASTKCGSS
jgi:phospholipase C